MTLKWNFHLHGQVLSEPVPCRRPAQPRARYTAPQQQKAWHPSRCPCGRPPACQPSQSHTCSSPRLLALWQTPRLPCHAAPSCPAPLAPLRCLRDVHASCAVSLPRPPPPGVTVRPLTPHTIQSQLPGQRIIMQRSSRWTRPRLQSAPITACHQYSELQCVISVHRLQ